MNKSFRGIKSIKDLTSVFINIFPIFFKTKNTLGIFSMCAYRYLKEDKGKYLKYLILNDDMFKIKTLFKNGLGFNIGKYVYYFNIYIVKVDTNKVILYPPQNLCTLVFKNNNKEIFFPIVYNAIYYKKYLGKVGKLFKFENKDLTCYFRQTKMNSIALTVRKNNITDSFKEKNKIFLAKVLPLVTPKKDIILLYEKECNKYEESSSVVYERLIDLGYDNAYYLIKNTSKHLVFIREKYQKNVIYAYSFKHYYYWFKCNKFIATETVPHSIELRAANQFITRKMIEKRYQQVFLQHGVMYMVALNPITRGAFLKGNNEMPISAKIVVSSKLEAEHFISLGGYNIDDLYITGLPFYDRTIKKENADKIVVMLTARIWETNILETNYKESKYYKMLKNIINNIPKEYKDKVYVLPHPLLLDKFKNMDITIPEILSYDKILEDTALLITDYSSIAYSAFYRGSNVIFCFEELDACMEKFESYLMLNEDNIFGDISYDYKDLGELIKKNYLKPQSKKNINRYKKIVEFHDNKNTDRLIECLKKDGII